MAGFADSSVILLAGLIAGMMNAAAGGGSFVTVPALIFVGVPSVAANMSSTVALYPGSIASAWVFRGRLRTVLAIPIWALFLSTLAGGFGGALLLLFTPNSAFDRIVPWLLLAGSLAFAFAPAIGARLQRHFRPNAAFLLAVQFVLGIYGGYFGGAVGILMMAVWSVLGLGEIQSMNGLKVVLVAAANTVAVVCFAVAGQVVWRVALEMMAAAAAGGYLGARLSLRLRSSQIRAAICVLNFLIAAVFLWTRR
jgi:uncharacterized membrane protein YfcA